MNKIVSRKLWALAVAVTIIAAVMLPATTAQAQTAQSPAVSYPEFSLKWEKYMEREYWLFLTSEAEPLLHGVDGFSKREAVQIVANQILEQMDYYPGGEPGDVAAREWQRHWGNFFSRIARGQFTNSELRRAFRTWRNRTRVHYRARRHRHRHRTTGIRGVRYKT